MKSISDWDESDLLALISNQTPESLTLDYKQSRALSSANPRTELSKDVSSFANSAGGRLIYGIEEQNQIPIALDGGIDPQTMSRERLEQLIVDNIRPRLEGVVIQQIPHANGNVSYVIDIAQSTSFAPHMAEDKRYYRRHNFRTVSMEDYEVRDVMRRASTPRPVVRFTWARSPADGTCTLRATISNLGSEPMPYSITDIFLQPNMVPADFSIALWQRLGMATVTVTGHSVQFLRFTKTLSPPNAMPIFGRRNWALMTASMPSPDIGDYIIGYSVECPGVVQQVFGVIHLEAGADAKMLGPEEFFTEVQSSAS